MLANPLLSAFLSKLERRDSLSEAERDALRSAAGTELEHPADTDIVSEGDRPERSTLLLSGFATRYRVLSDGQRQITAIHVPGDFVDLHSLVLKTMDHSVGALTHCRVVSFAHTELTRITEDFPHLTRLLWLMTLIDGAIHREWIVAMGRRSAVQQLAHLICELYVRLGIVGMVSDSSFMLPISQAQLSDALGLSAVHVNRVLQSLRADKVISWQGQTVRILDWERLRDLAEFDPNYLHLNSERR